LTTFGVALSALVVGTTLALSDVAPRPANQGPPQAAVAQLARVRMALGGAAELASIRAVRISGTAAARLIGPRSLGNKLGRTVVELEEIRILFPDYYLTLRQDTAGSSASAPHTIQFTSPRRWGFARNTLIGRGNVQQAREKFGYFVLGLLLRTDSSFPFAIRAATGTALQFANPNGVEVFVDIDPATQLPRQIRFNEDLRLPNGELAGERAPRRIELADYKQVGRVRLPHLSIEFTGDRPNPLTRRISKIDLNPKLTPADFK
jgi:hypothetical protein